MLVGIEGFVVVKLPLHRFKVLEQLDLLAKFGDQQLKLDLVLVERALRLEDQILEREVLQEEALQFSSQS